MKTHTWRCALGFIENAVDKADREITAHTILANVSKTAQFG